MNLIKKDKVGEGASWKVFQCEASDKEYEYPLIIKIAKWKNASFIYDNIRRHEQVKMLGLPTLALLQLVVFENEPALLGEYLNRDGWLYVATNSVVTQSQRMLRQMETGNDTFDCEPLAENWLYDHKLSDLINFPDFLDNVIEDIRTGSKARLEIYFDSYFFGIRKGEEVSEIRYIIGDFDQVFHKPGIPADGLFAYNIVEFKDTMDAFIRNFIVTANQSLYLNIAARKLSKYN